MGNNSYNPMRLDANESAFFERELEHVKSKTYDVKYPQLKAFDLLPVSTEANPGAEEITFRRYKAVGMAKIVADYSKDFPRVDVYGEEVTSKIKSIGDSYGYSIQEIRGSMMAGKSLDSRRASAAKRAIDEKLNNMAFITNKREGTNGILNYPGISEIVIPADGTGNSTKWDDKTPEQILRDIRLIVSGVVEPTKSIEDPDTLILPLHQYELITQVDIGDVNKTTIMNYFLKNSPHIKNILWLNELKGIGAGETDRAMVGKFDAEHVTLELPQPFEQFEPDKKAMSYDIVCHARCAGCIVYYPMAFCYADGI